MQYKLGTNPNDEVLRVYTLRSHVLIAAYDPEFDEYGTDRENDAVKLSRDNARELVKVLNEWLEGRWVMTDDRLPRCRARGLTIREDGSPYIDLADLATTLPPAECAELLVALSGKTVSVRGPYAHNVERWLAGREKHA